MDHVELYHKLFHSIVSLLKECRDPEWVANQVLSETLESLSQVPGDVALSILENAVELANDLTLK